MSWGDKKAAGLVGRQLPVVLDYGPIDRARATLGCVIWREAFDALLRATHRAFDVEADRLIRQDRSAEVCEARFALVWCARQLTPWSLPTLGERLGGRDHTTIMHAVKQAERLRKSSTRFRLLTDAMIETLVEAARDQARAVAAVYGPATPAPQQEAADAR